MINNRNHYPTTTTLSNITVGALSGETVEFNKITIQNETILCRHLIMSKFVWQVHYNTVQY